MSALVVVEAGGGGGRGNDGGRVEREWKEVVL